MKMRTYEEYTEKDWKKLDGYDWVCLLREQPIFAKHCESEKLDGLDWSCLLTEQPKFAKHCDWKKLNRYDWYWLLRGQPQFKKYKKQLEKEGKK